LFALRQVCTGKKMQAEKKPVDQAARSTRCQTLWRPCANLGIAALLRDGGAAMSRPQGSENLNCCSIVYTVLQLYADRDSPSNCKLPTFLFIFDPLAMCIALFSPRRKGEIVRIMNAIFVPPAVTKLLLMHAGRQVTGAVKNWTLRRQAGEGWQMTETAPMHACSSVLHQDYRIDARTWRRTVGAIARDSLRPHGAVGSPYTCVWHRGVDTGRCVPARWLPT
jgi:hypothetical protein